MTRYFRTRNGPYAWLVARLCARLYLLARRFRRNHGGEGAEKSLFFNLYSANPCCMPARIIWLKLATSSGKLHRNSDQVKWRSCVAIDNKLPIPNIVGHDATILISTGDIAHYLASHKQGRDLHIHAHRAGAGFEIWIFQIFKWQNFFWQCKVYIHIT